MTHSNDSRRPRRTRRQFTAAALVLFVSVGSARQASAADPRSADSDAPGRLGAGSLSALVMDPDIPTTVYAGTSCSGVLKSLDGGDSWQPASTGLPGPMVSVLAIDPENPSTLYAGMYYGGLFKSTDGGGTWSATGLTSSVFLLTIAPTTPATLYAENFSGGLYRARMAGIPGALD